MATMGLILPHGQPGDKRLRITALQREFVTFTLWVGTTFIQFDGDGLLLYPLALYFAVRAWQERSAILGLMARSWPIMLFPLWCLISPIWAVEPMTAFKNALYLMLTMVICYHVVLHLPARQIMYAVLLATGFAGALNFVLGLASGGHFGYALFSHKNRMGGNMVILWVVALSIVLSARAPLLLRLVSAVCGVLAAFLIFNSDSATAILQMIGTAGICVLSTILMRGGFLRPSKLALTCLLLALTMGLASIAASSFKGNPVDETLHYFGKDRTLTGRTVLWDYAEAQIEQRPLLGVGSGGFWRYSVSPVVQRIYEEFYKRPTDHFNFHNSFYEIAIHQGLIGVGLTLIAIAWALYWLFQGAIVGGGMPQIFFLSTAATVLVRAMTEGEFFVPFVLFHMLIWIGALAAVRARSDARSIGRVA